MTSTSLAQSRPPPMISLPSTLARSHSRPQVPLISDAREVQGIAQDHAGDLVNNRPVKRRKLSSGSSVVSASSPSQSPADGVKYLGASWSNVIRLDTEDRVDSNADAPLLPLPERPWATELSKDTALQDIKPSVRVRKNVAVPTTPDCSYTPIDTPHFERKKLADYFPWTGKHPEDVLNEVHVKQGYLDRPPNPPEKELNTAKPPLYNAFKHRSGLESLSALFSLVLESRNKHGALGTTSTFKGPPPRVTLTEAKRKSWISDLANADVPLRKLSKTIPQGVRGTMLLDQCLHNSIPHSRAIWFIKCVGANEIRTLRRKGVASTMTQGTEAKWLKDWTLNVEQFLEGGLAQCGQAKWKERMRYSILLSARLYCENLLDRDHYLEWIVKSLASATTNHWPFWLLVVHLHRVDLVSFRKRGKQLAETLVLKFNATHSSPGDVLQPLAQSFAAVIRPLIVAKPGCFLMPDRWTDCHKALENCLDINNALEQRAFERLKIANESVSGRVRHDGTLGSSPLERVVEVLDSAQSFSSMPTLYEKLHQVCSDEVMLMVKCLEWCVSRFRTGNSRIYLCARIFRKWHRQGFDTDSVILDFIFNNDNIDVIDVSAWKHLVSELSRSRTFPFSKYMQWLAVRGLPRSGSFVSHSITIQSETGTEKLAIQKCHDASQVLTDLCLLNAEDHLANLRHSILSRAGFSEEVESLSYEKLQHVLQSVLNESDRLGNAPVLAQISHNDISWSVRTKLSHWLRMETVRLAKNSHLDTPGQPPLPGARRLTVKRFQIIRDVLEKLHDFAILADILRITAVSRQEGVLAAAVDTLNLHSATFSTIGALEPLQALYCQSYLTLRPAKTTMPLFVSSLIDLCQQHPVKAVPVRALQQDLIRGDRGRAVTACSPFSDGIAESLQQAGATFNDDFEAILQTESNMTEQTMLRLFKVLIERIEKLQHNDEMMQQIFHLCQLLARLKLCQKAQGELLIKKWISKLNLDSNRPMSFGLLLCLLHTHCVALDVITDACQQLPATCAARRQFYDRVRFVLVEQGRDEFDESLWYSFKIAVFKLISTRSVELLEIIGTDESGQSSNTPFKSAVISIVVNNPDMIKSLSKPGWMVLSQTLTENLNAINTSEPPEIQAKLLTDAAGPLSLPFCSLRMRMLCQNAAIKSDEKIQDEIAARLCSSVANSTSLLSTSPRTFQAVLRATGPVISAKVRSCIEQSFYQGLPRFLQNKGPSSLLLPTPEESRRTAAALQQVILVNNDVAVSAVSNSNSSLIEKLTIYMKIMSSQNIGCQTPTTPSTIGLPNETTLHAFIFATLDHLTCLLQMVCVKRPVFASLQSASPPATAKSLQQEQIKLVGLVITIATNAVWSSLLSSSSEQANQDKIRGTIEFAFDVAATLTDDMSEESRVFCAKILKDKLRHERVRWLLGSVNLFGSAQNPDAGHGYQVVHESKGVVGDWKPKVWEMLESGSSNDSSLGLGLFGARKV